MAAVDTIRLVAECRLFVQPIQKGAYKLGALAKQVTKQRRAHSAAESGGRVVRGGDRDLADAAAQALLGAQQKTDIRKRLTHPVHGFPARMHPATARKLVATVLEDRARSAEPPTVLDPFCGSGTVLVEGLRAGARAIGVDINPVAVSIATAKTWTAVGTRRAELRRSGRRIAGMALEEGKAARRAGYQTPAERAPRGVDAKLRNRRLSEWFAPHVRRELEHMSGAIERIGGSDRELGVALEVVLSSVLYKVSRRASDTDPSRVERRVGRGAAARQFERRVEELCVGLTALARTAPEPGQVLCGDARQLARLGLKAGIADAVVSSPPYAGTYDYVDQHRLRLDFLGLDAEGFREAEIGSRRGFRGNAAERRHARRRWDRDLAATFAEMARVLVPKGRAAVVMGDSVAGTRPVFAEEVVRVASAEHFVLVAWAGQARPKLGSAELKAFSTRGKREYVFLLAKK